MENYMKKTRFTESQIINILKEDESSALTCQSYAANIMWVKIPITNGNLNMVVCKPLI